jgi:hypothetical protein
MPVTRTEPNSSVVPSSMDPSVIFSRYLAPATVFPFLLIRRISIQVFFEEVRHSRERNADAQRTVMRFDGLDYMIECSIAAESRSGKRQKQNHEPGSHFVCLRVNWQAVRSSLGI